MSDYVYGMEALVVIDLQNDITKHYKEIIDRVNEAIDWMVARGGYVFYIKHNNPSPGTRTFKAGTRGAELVPELKIVSDYIFVKTKSNALTSDEFDKFISNNGVEIFYLVGGDATACIKSTAMNMALREYQVHVLSDCITSYNPSKIEGMLEYYRKKGCDVATLAEAMEKAPEGIGPFDPADYEDPPMETERLVLREWRESDAQALFKYASDPEVGPRAGWNPHKDVEQSGRVIRELYWRTNMWAVVLRSTGEPIGCVGYLGRALSHIPIGKRECEVGFWIGRPYWNEGICTEALQRIVRRCFENGYATLWGCYFDDNPASRRVMEKCGFTPTGDEVLATNLDYGADKPARVMRLDKDGYEG